MKEAIALRDAKVEIRDADVPVAKAGHVVIKVIYAGSNPKDWKSTEMFPDVAPSNQGNDMAGLVHSIGEGVTGFHVGDRVAAFAGMKGGGHAEYALARANNTFHLPANTSFQEGAAIPLAALTAVIGLWANDRLNLPQPGSPATSPIPLVVYGGSSAVGSYTIQLAKRSNIHPIIAVAGRAREHVEKMLEPSKGDVYIDYRKGDDAVVERIKTALRGQKLYHAYDATVAQNSFQNLVKVLEPQGSRITLVLPPPEAFKNGDFKTKHKEIPASINQSFTSVGDVDTDCTDLGYLYTRYFTLGLEEGWFKAQPHEEVPGGLAGLASAWSRLKDGSASATKFVSKIADTPGVGK